MLLVKLHEGFGLRFPISFMLILEFFDLRLDTGHVFLGFGGLEHQGGEDQTNDNSEKNYGQTQIWYGEHRIKPNQAVKKRPV